MIRDPSLPEAPPAWVGDIPAPWSAARGGSAALVTERAAHSWAELDAARLAWRARLEQAGVRPGDRVMVVGENSPAMVMLLFAIVSLRAWVVNVNARLSAREVDAIRAHGGARRVIHLVEGSPDAAAHARRHDAGALDGGAWGALAMTASNEAAEPEPVAGDPAADVAALLYTTGTTGEPKAVMLTHANLMFIARNSVLLRRITPDDRVYGLLPLTHVYGMASVGLGSLLGGASVHLQARFAPESAARFIREQRLTVCQGVPAMYAKLLEHLKARGDTRFEAPALRFLYAGGSPLDPALKREVEAFFGLRLHNGYGLTEASPTLTQTRHESPRDDCSVGPAIPGVTLRIVDNAGHDVPDGEVGELWARGPNVMKGYYKDPRATDAAIRPGRWLATGDLARRDADGAIHIVGRSKELIIRSGFNVFPVEVEAVLNAHPAVTQSAVVGRSVAGDEEVVAFVELRPDMHADEREIAAFAAKALAPYKRPSQVVILPSLPAAPSGKVLKAKLAQMARELRPATERG